jgi:CubicO group peptidase (beta-lactamase class C family)
MSSFQQALNALDPSILSILGISNTARCSIYSSAEHKNSHATYHKPADDQAERDPICNEDLLFQCASLFKVFIAASLVLMIDKLSADPSTTNKYHELKGAWNTPFTVVFNNVAREEGCSMRALHGDPSVLQLLLHYNGVYDINHILLAPDGTPLQGLEGVIDRISQYAEDTRAQPGKGEKQIRYSNANYILLALLIDKASKSFNGFLKEYIFKPFKMDRTFLSLEDLRFHSNEIERQPHVVSSNRLRRPFRPDTILGLSDLVEIAWLGPYISAADLARFFEGLISAKDGNPIGLFDKAVFESLGSSKSSSNEQSGYTRCGLFTALNSTGPGSHSLNRLISPDSNLKNQVLGKASDDEDAINAFYLAGSATGWASTVYFIPHKRTFVIVLTNTSGPLDASDLIARLCLQEILDLQPSNAGIRFSLHLSKRGVMTSADRRAHYVDLARQMFDENALKVAELEQYDNQPDTPTSAYPNLPGKYYCSRNGQYLHIIDWKGKDNEKPEGVLRVVIQSGKKRSQQLRFVKRGERFRMCSPENSSVLAIDCFGAWENLEFEVERDDAGVKAVSRQGMHLKDFFIRETP